MPTRRLEVEIVGDTKSLDRAYDRTTRSSKKLGASLGSIGKAGLIGAGVAAGAAVGLKVLKSVVRAAEEAQVAQAGLNQAFAAAGVSTARYGKQVDATIQKTSKLAGIDDELVSKQYANLLRTTGSVSKATRDIGIAADIARARHISLAAAAKVVEKAENGQLRGLKALGVQVGKHTTGTEALEAAQKKFAGSAEAYGKTAAGAQDKLSVAFENLQERVGAKLLPVLTRLSLRLVDLIDWSEKNWPKFSAAVQQVYAKSKPVIDNLVARFRDIAKVFEGVVRIVRGIANGEWSQVWSGIKLVAVNEIKLLYHSFLELPKKLVAALGRKAWAGLKAVGGYIGDAIMAGLRAVLQKAADFIDAFTGKIDGISGALNKVLPKGHEIEKIPKIGDIGGGQKRVAPGSGLRRAAPVGNPGDSADRAPSSRGGSTPVVIQLDSRVIATAIVPHLEKNRKKTVVQSSGRQPGQRPF